MNNDMPEDDYVLTRYCTAIEYYWKASRHNKRAYKTTRSLVVILGASVTLAASLSSSNLIASSPIWDTTLAIAAPVMAAILTIVGGFSQSFHWGATWRDMVLNAERLERELDRIRVLKADDRDQAKELATLNALIIEESETFFQRILGGSKRDKKTTAD
ncbi:MAG: DUF4231 domain-containing protein [Desulfobacteraceae bacterium]